MKRKLSTIIVALFIALVCAFANTTQTYAWDGEDDEEVTIVIEDDAKKAAEAEAEAAAKAKAEAEAAAKAKAEAEAAAKAKAEAEAAAKAKAEAEAAAKAKAEAEAAAKKAAKKTAEEAGRPEDEPEISSSDWLQQLGCTPAEKTIVSEPLPKGEDVTPEPSPTPDVTPEPSPTPDVTPEPSPTPDAQDITTEITVQKPPMPPTAAKPTKRIPDTSDDSNVAYQIMFGVAAAAILLFGGMRVAIAKKEQA